MKSWFRKYLNRSSFATLMAAKAIVSPVALGAHGLVVNRDGRVLLARHSYMRGWSLPGGGVARGEPPDVAVMRELSEELGTIRADPPVLLGLYTRRSGWATNVVVLYKLSNAEVDFRPSREVREIVFADPANPPRGTASGTRRRLAELLGQPPSPYW